MLEAADESVPLYSRIQFLSIFSSNIDEFFRVRMPSIYAFTSINAKKTALRDEYPENLAHAVIEYLQSQLEDFTTLLVCRIAFVYGIPTIEDNKASVVGAIW